MRNTPRVESHACSVAGCGTEIPRAMLMCHSHWRMVPAALRRRVLDAYDRWALGDAAAALQSLRAVQAEATRAVEGGAA